MKTVTVSEAALDSLKAMGQRDKERIEELESMLRNIQGIIRHHRTTYAGLISVIDGVNPYSSAVIEKAE